MLWVLMDKIPQLPTSIYKVKRILFIMPDEDRRPKQLDRIRKENYDKLYARQPQLMEKLSPLLNKSDIIEEQTEPFLYSPKDPLKEKLTEPKLNGKMDKRKVLKEKLNVFTHSRKLSKEPTTKKISEVRPDVLWNLS